MKEKQMTVQKQGRPRVDRPESLYPMMVRVERSDHETLKKIACHYEISVPELCRFYLKLGISDASDDGIVAEFAAQNIKKTKWYKEIQTKSQK